MSRRAAARLVIIPWAAVTVFSGTDLRYKNCKVQHKSIPSSQPKSRPVTYQDSPMDKESQPLSYSSYQPEVWILLYPIYQAEEDRTPTVALQQYSRLNGNRKPTAPTTDGTFTMETTKM
ncbi:hypothetical protein Pcinc_019194 [Petrolisthes cinctipes]|uniref:Uncharacterized protein n=1 Tax=Petrolisthes cinctipes TaxID=88211 RepID=A0AAE1FKR5_PETCI|nr:hypothetical protein Pcinc_019194 [Petrolisthes cinctipes]